MSHKNTAKDYVFPTSLLNCLNVQLKITNCFKWLDLLCNCAWLSSQVQAFYDLGEKKPHHGTRQCPESPPDYTRVFSVRTDVHQEC